MHKIKSIHFVGIKGVGMTPLAIIAKEAGIKVTGSDLTDEFITDEVLKKSGITLLEGFSKTNIKNVDLVIATGAHGGFENEEVKEAKRKNIKVLTQGEAVGIFMDGKIFERKFDGISIAGSHGKTTTTALTAAIFKESGVDPSFIIGTGNIPFLGSSGHYGKGNYFIAEADEYATEPTFNKKSKFLWQYPKIAVFTNIDFDHPDLFNSIEEVKNAFFAFATQVAFKNGVLVVNGDDIHIKKTLENYTGEKITFGFSPRNDYVITKINVSDFQTFFWVETHGVSLGEFAIKLVGEHNALNALAAAIVALQAGIKLEEIKKTLKVFSGTKRRFEHVGELFSGALLYDDYAHHPTEIKKTLRAFRQVFPKNQIICIFQPHTHSRTEKLFDEFSYSFNDANLLILTDIYPSSREKDSDYSISSKKLFEKISRFKNQVMFLAKPQDVIEYIRQKQYKKDTIVITMGAGDIYKIWKGLKINK